MNVTTHQPHGRCQKAQPEAPRCAPCASQQGFLEHNCCLHTIMFIHSRTPAITQVRPPCAQAQWCENPRAGLEARRRTCLAHGHSAGQSPSKPAPFLLTIVPLVAEEHRHSEAGHAFLRQVHLPAPTTRHQRQRGNRSSADPRYPVIILIPCRARTLSLPLPVSLPLSISQSLARARARVRVLRARGYAHVRARSLSTLQYNGNCIA
jgi:hypothetical protein